MGHPVGLILSLCLVALHHLMDIYPVRWLGLIFLGLRTRPRSLSLTHFRLRDNLILFLGRFGSKGIDILKCSLVGLFVEGKMPYFVIARLAKQILGCIEDMVICVLANDLFFFSSNLSRIVTEFYLTAHGIVAASLFLCVIGL